MLCHVLKSITMLPTSIKKQLSNQCSNCNRFQSQLGSILGGFWRSRWSQDGTKSVQKSIQKSSEKMITFWIAPKPIFGHFGRQLGPQEGKPILRFGSIFLSWCPLGPKSPPRPPQDPPGRLQDASKTPLESNF